MNIYVIRHAEAEHNILDVSNDSTSQTVNLTEKGITQATQRAKDLQDIHFDAIYTSEMDRTVQTANILCPGKEIIKDERINDIRTGMEGRPFSEFREALANSDDPWNATFGNGESFNDEKARTISFLNDLITHDYQNVLVVTHGGVANIIYGIWHHLTNEETFNRPIDNVAMFTVNTAELK